MTRRSRRTVATLAVAGLAAGLAGFTFGASASAEVPGRSRGQVATPPPPGSGVTIIIEEPPPPPPPPQPIGPRSLT